MASVARATLVTVGCGAVLVVAALLKVDAAADGRLPPMLAGWPGWAVWGLVGVELAVGWWLAAGWGRAAARLMGATLFAAFAAVNLYLVWSGRADCGCFGRYFASPRVMLAIDLAAVGGLVAWPARRASGPAAQAGRWRGVLVSAGVLAGVAGVVTVRTPGPGGRGVTMDRYEHDFGEVPSSTVHTHTFQLTNATDEPVTLLQVKSTCSCSSTADLAGRVVGAHSSVDVPVSLKVAEDVDDQFAELTVFYQTAAGRLPAHLSVRVRATPRPDFRVRPATRHIDLETADVHVVEIEPLHLPAARLTAATCADPRVRATVRPDGLSAEIRVSGAGASPNLAGIGTAVVFTTSSERQSRFAVYVQGAYTPKAEVRPSSVTIPSTVAGRVERELVVVAPGVARIRSVTSDSEDVRITQADDGPDRPKRITLSIPDAKSGDWTCQIRIRLEGLGGGNPEDDCTIVVPVYRLTLPH